jgi:hypothetical protein
MGSRGRSLPDIVHQQSAADPKEGTCQAITILWVGTVRSNKRITRDIPDTVN